MFSALDWGELIRCAIVRNAKDGVARHLGDPSVGCRRIEWPSLRGMQLPHGTPASPQCLLPSSLSILRKSASDVQWLHFDTIDARHSSSSRPDNTVLAVSQLNGTAHEFTEQHRLMSTHGNFGV
ncbi:hypothetical protein IG631_20170 [Alternaria alternata]|nr:hypothetical protein IG631_20170 [Alternaria alternata]